MMRLPSPSWRRCAGLLGLPGWLGLLLGLAAALAWWGWWPNVQAKLDEQAAQLTGLRRRLQAGQATGSAASGPGSVATLADRAQAAWGAAWPTLATPAQGAERQVDVLAQARARGVQAQSVQYKGAPLKGLPAVWRQQMSLPVDAPYPALRAWLAHLQTQPGLSIDALDIGRVDPMSDQVKARVAISVWWRTADPEARP